MEKKRISKYEDLTRTQTNRRKTIEIKIHINFDLYSSSSSNLKKWQTIVTNFSDLEYEFMDQESRQQQASDSSMGIQSMDSSLANMNATVAAATTTSSSAGNDSVNSSYSCIVDRHRIIKHSSATATVAAGGKQTNKTKQLTLTPAIASNMNLFYELMQAMPELSKLQIR